MVEPRTYSHMATGTGTVRQPVTNGQWIQKLFDCFFFDTFISHIRNANFVNFEGVDLTG